MKILPPRQGWLRLLTSPSSYALSAVAVLTVVIKAIVARTLVHGAQWPLFVTWACAADLAAYFGFAALFAFGEGRFRWIRAASWPLAALVAFVALTNAGYLYVTGEQLAWGTFSLGLDRFADFWSISREHLHSFGWTRVALIAAAVVGLPATLYFATRTGNPRAEGRQRAGCALLVALVGATLALVLPRPTEPPARRLGANAALETYWTWVTAPPPGGGHFAGYDPSQLVSAPEIARFAAGPRPNVLLVVLESTRFDHTALAGPAAAAATPHLLALADRGTRALAARAVVPHTTKSLFTVLCARYPVMQRAVIEIAGKFAAQCLPAVLRDAGYRAGFFQSAAGGFEYRFHYVKVLGYRFFAAWEDLRGEQLGYLASDDASLVDPVIGWIDAAGGAPWFATVLTSATHHPYRLPASIAARAAAARLPVDSNEQRYSRLVEGEDDVLGRLLRALDERKLTDSTLVIVLGDHGEGFGERGVRQHDNNYFEEGLHVPLVFAGPGVPRGAIPENVSLLDITPTILGRLGVRILPGADGIDVLSAPPPRDRVMVFNCWEEERCRGFIRGTDKVVHIPETGDVFGYDLAADPTEAHARAVSPELEALRLRVEELIAAHRANEKDIAGF